MVWSWVSNMFSSFSFHYFTCCTNVLESMKGKRLNGILKCTHTKSKLQFLELQWLPWLHKKQRWERPELPYMVVFSWCCSSFTKLNTYSIMAICHFSCAVSIDYCTDFQMWINVSCLSLFTVEFEHTYHVVIAMHRKRTEQTKSLFNGRNTLRYRKSILQSL